MPILFFLFLIVMRPADNYQDYHDKVLEIEKMIIEKAYLPALNAYENLFKEYDFVFVRDYKVATQIAWTVSDTTRTAELMEAAIKAGWTMKSLRKNECLKSFRKVDHWQMIKTNYKEWRRFHESKIDQELKKELKKRIKKDQWKALGALFTFSATAQDRYAEKKFAPHSEQQMEKLQSILETEGYPGEQVIGNNFWASTIISHHNSISTSYAQKDSLYPKMKPLLKKAWQAGQISPFEMALMDDWYRLVKNDRQVIAYGIVESPKLGTLETTNALRESLGLRSVQTRNALVDIQIKTGINFYLPGSPWIDGKIVVR